MAKPEDTESYRKQLWEKEYLSRKNLPSTNTTHPSTSLRVFFEKYPGINKGAALDLGSGNGRNSIYMARQGFKYVLGIEISEEAVKQAELSRDGAGIDSKAMEFWNQSLGEKINKPDASFDLVADMMTVHSLTEKSRASLFMEIKRLLKPDGYFIFFTIAADSPAAIELMKEMPGPEENSYRFKVEEDIVTEKAFTKEELIEALSPLKLVYWEASTHFTPAFGDVFERVYYWGIMQKVRE